MQQYFAKNKNLDLEDGDYHHIKNVMKMKCGDLIKVVYNNVIYTCKLNNVSNKSTFDITVISDILNLKNLVNLDYDLKLVCSLNKNTKNIKKILEKNNKCVKILLVVGPEGGFDPLEEEYLLENGFKSVSLGENVLRAETAPVVALSMINYEFWR